MTIIQAIQEKFKDVTFDEEIHRYTINGNTAASVSSVIKKFYNEFDASKYPAFLQKQWKQKGKDAANAGTKIHTFAERYIESCAKPTNLKELGVIAFILSLDTTRYTIVSIEQRMYQFEYDYFGTCDLLLYDNIDKHYILADWKSNESLEKNYGDMMLEPFEDMLNTPFNRYQLQMAHYELCLEQVENLNVEERWIIHLTGKLDNLFAVYPCEDFTTKLKEYYGRGI